MVGLMAAVLWRSDLIADVKIIESTSRRMCAIKMITAQIRILSSMCMKEMIV
jgi:hypothetical protein